jgi:hypothetical protein
MLDMQYYADAVIGALSEGLNVERKRLTIGVELASTPLLFQIPQPFIYAPANMVALTTSLELVVT